MLGVVPVVVFGVVPGVVLGVVPVVVLDVEGAVLVLGTPPGVDGGQIVLPPPVLGDAPGMVALGLVPEGLDVLDIGEEEPLDGVVVVTGHVAEGVDGVEDGLGLVF